MNEVAGLTLVEEKYGLHIDVPGSVILTSFGLNVLGYWDDAYNLAVMCVSFLVVAFLWLQFAVKEQR